MKQRKRSQHQNNKKTAAPEKKTYDKATLIQAAVLMLGSFAFLVAACVALSGMGFFHMVKGWTIPKGRAIVGVISEDGQITDIPEGEIRFRVNSDVVFDNSYGRGNIMLENPKVSKYDLQFSIFLQRNNEKPVYISPVLNPGECILSDKLTERIGKGYYVCTCVVKAYDSAGEYCGENTATVRLNIEKN